LHLLEQRDEEVDSLVDVLKNLLRSHLDVADSNAEGKHPTGEQINLEQLTSSSGT
jgi:hypothetical protein